MAPGAPAEADGAVLRQGVGKEDPGPQLEAVLNIDHTLILEAGVAREEVLFALLLWTSNFLIIPKVGQIFLDFILRLICSSRPGCSTSERPVMFGFK